MPPRGWRLRAQDMVDEAELILDHVRGRDAAAFLEDKVLQAAVLYRLAVIGEAVAHIPTGVRDRHPEIPWRQIRDMRNVLTHAYFGVDLSRVWSVVDGHLATLVTQMRAIIEHEAGPEA